MLARLGLRLHPQKTRVVRAEDGFDFLGVHFRLCLVRKRQSKLKRYCAVWPSDRSLERIKQRMREVIGRRYGLSLEALISELTPHYQGLEQLPQSGKTGAKASKETQCLCPGTNPSIPEAEIQ